jgi:hypothetical protein
MKRKLFKTDRNWDQQHTEVVFLLAMKSRLPGLKLCLGENSKATEGKQR